jgi:adenine-specific DNA-methyltransferase
MGKNEKGQYFTTDKTLKKYLVSFIKNIEDISVSQKILEPSVGRGDLVIATKKRYKNVEFCMYEIDPTIKFFKGLRKDIIFQDFLKCEITEKYRTIIGNPPYIKTGGYLDFITKCFNLLKKNGELIFIVPAVFFKNTGSIKLLEKMMDKGSFTDIYKPFSENLFRGASINVILFRYQKSLLQKAPYKIGYYSDQSDYSGIPMKNTDYFLYNSQGMISFEKGVDTLGMGISNINLYGQINNTQSVQDLFTVHVGLVSGCESVFKTNIGNTDILTDKNKREKYILLREFPTENTKIDKYMLDNKQKLLDRRIRKFNDKNWFEFGALRNINVMDIFRGQDCIYMINQSRKKEIAFRGKVEYFGGKLLLLIPREEINLDIFTDFFNSDLFKNNFMYSGRFKISHGQLSKSVVKII